MKISLLGGTGSFAEGLVIRWAKAGHEVIIGSRTQEKADAAAAEIGAKAKEQGVGGNIVKEFYTNIQQSHFTLCINGTGNFWKQIFTHFD